MKKEILFLAALATCLSSFGQTFEKTAQGGKFQTAQPTLNGEVIFYSPSIVRIVKYPSAEMPEKKRNFKMTPQQLEAAITPKTKMLILCSPSNPTGWNHRKR